MGRNRRGVNRSTRVTTRGQPGTRMCKRCGGKGRIEKKLMKVDGFGRIQFVPGPCDGCQGRGRR